MQRHLRGGYGCIELVQGDIVVQEVDAIVNAANTTLLGGGGVDGAIHRAAGPTLLAECKRLPVDADSRRCPTGEVRVTGAGRLPARHVIHAVGPVFDVEHTAQSDADLARVHHNALVAAEDHRCRSVALPAISTGAYGFPNVRAASIAIGAAVAFLTAELRRLVLVRFVLFNAADLAVFTQALAAAGDKE